MPEAVETPSLRQIFAAGLAEDVAADSVGGLEAMHYAEQLLNPRVSLFVSLKSLTHDEACYWQAVLRL